MEIMSDDKITVDQLLASGYQATTWVNDYWKFYITFGGLILSARFASDNPWNLTQRLVVILLYIVFVVLNIEALFRGYMLMSAAAHALPVSWQQDQNSRMLLRHFDMPWCRWRRVVHVVADTVIILCIGCYPGKNAF